MATIWNVLSLCWLLLLGDICGPSRSSAKVDAFQNHTYSHLGQYGNSIFLVRGKLKRRLAGDEIAQAETIRLMNLDQSIRNITHLHFKSLRSGPDIPPIHQLSDNVDDVTRAMLEVNKVLQGRLLRKPFFLGEYENPSVAPFRGRLLLSTGLAYHGDMLKFQWVNYSNGSNFTIAPGREELHGLNTSLLSAAGADILGMDTRLLVVNSEKVVVAFTNRFITPRSRMGIAEFIIDPITQKFSRGTTYNILYWNSREIEKNWSPFLVNGRDVYLVQNINPLHIVGYVGSHDDTSAAITLSASTAPLGHHSYRFGAMRGGSNAIDMGDYYLAMFHSVYRVNPGIQTYFMGAYTFTKKQPWRLLAASPQPLLDEAFYTGQWAPLGRNRLIDYVLFPTGLFYDNATQEVVVSVGVQDLHGYLVRISLSELLYSLEPVIYCDNDPIHQNEAYDMRHHPELRAHYCHPVTNIGASGAGSEDLRGKHALRRR